MENVFAKIYGKERIVPKRLVTMTAMETVPV